MQGLQASRTVNALRGACGRQHILPSGPVAAASSPALGRRPSTITALQSRSIATPARQFHRGCLGRPIVSMGSSPLQVRRASSAADSGPLQKTPLYDLHLAHGAKMVPFGGFSMPVQYAGLSVSQSHVFTRTQASIFDVGHMVQRLFKGPGATAFLQRLTPSNLEALGAHRSTLSVLLHADGTGGIVDDTIVTKLGDGTFYVVTNAGCREKDDQYLGQEMAKWNAEGGHENLQVTQEQLGGWGLVALQGPGAEAILQDALADSESLELKGLFFGQCVYAKLKLPGSGTSQPVLISRGGYTGEDGFEISIHPEDTVGVTETLLAAGPEKVQMAGLGARDSLRLEAGMCLYGHDLDEQTTPVEAGLSWIIPKERRTADAGFYGAEHISKQLVLRSKGGLGVQFRRVGLLVEGSPAREGAQIVSPAGQDAANIGRVTSGCPSPTLGKNIAMGYIKDGLHKAGTEVAVLVRGKPRKAVVAKMPFVPTKYWKGL